MILFRFIVLLLCDPMLYKDAKKFFCDIIFKNRQEEIDCLGQFENRAIHTKRTNRSIQAYKDELKLESMSICKIV